MFQTSLMIEITTFRKTLQHAKTSKNRKNATGVTNTVSIVNENKIVKCNITTEVMIIDHLFPKTFYGRYFQLLEKRQNPLKNGKNDCFCNNTTNKIKITASMKNKQHLFNVKAIFKLSTSKKKIAVPTAVPTALQFLISQKKDKICGESGSTKKTSNIL